MGRCIAEIARDYAPMEVEKANRWRLHFGRNFERRGPPRRRSAWCRSISAPTSWWWRSPTRSRSPGLSPYAAEPNLSVVAEQARAFRRLDWQAEATIALQPDLVLIGPTTAR